MRHVLFARILPFLGLLLCVSSLRADPNFTPEISFAGELTRRTADLPATVQRLSILLRVNPREVLRQLDSLHVDPTDAKAYSHWIDLQLIKLTAYYYLYDANGGLRLAASLERELGHMDPRQLALYTLDIGSIYYVTGQYQKALDSFDKAIKMAQDNAFADIEVLASNEAAWCLVNLKKNDKAIEFVNRAYELAKKLADPYLLAYTYTALSGVQSGSQRAEQSKEAAQQAIRLFKALGYDYHLTIALFNLGMAYYNEGKRAEAKPILDEAKVLANRIEDVSTYFYCLLVLGRILESEGNNEEALRSFLKATEFFYAEQDFTTFLESAASANKLLSQAGQKDKALLNLQRAEDWWKKVELNQQPQTKLKLLDMRHVYEARFGTPERHNKILIEYLQWQRIRLVELEKTAVARSSAQMELEFKEEQNRMLKQVNVLQSEQISNLSLIRSLFIFSLLTIVVIIVLFAYSIKAGRRMKLQKNEVDRILQNIQEGIITFKRDHYLLGSYSRFAQEVFGQGRERLGGLPLRELFSAFGEEGARLWNNTESVLTAMWDEEILAWELNASNLPNEAHLRDRTFHFRWYPVFENRRLHEVMLVLADNTELVAAKANEDARNKHIKSLTLAMSELFSVNGRRAIKFLREVQVELNQFSDDKVQSLAFRRYLHTIKGNSRTLGLARLSQVIHDMESQLGCDQGWTAALYEFYQCVNFYLDFARELGIESASTLNERSALESIDSIHQDLDAHVRQNGFEAVDLEINLSLPEWNPSMSKLFHTISLHALTNAVEHGFIHAGQRKAELPKRIKLSISVQLSGNRELHMTFRDNGAGIPWSRVAEIAQAQKFVPGPQRPLSDVLFLDNVSTAEKLSERSGRGVGLTAIAVEVRALGGDLVLQDNTIGRGSELSIVLPYPLPSLVDDPLPLAN